MAKYRILLADSNNQFQTTVRDYLTAQEGIERVDTVNDGQSALDAMNNNRYDVLLCDLIMPGMDGFKLLERPAHLAQSITWSSPSTPIRCTSA